MRTVVCSFLFLFSGGATLAAEEFGTISGTYDGETRSWYTITMTSGGKTMASATYRASRLGTNDFHIQGHPRPSFTTSDVLGIDAMFRGDLAAGALPLSVEIIYLPQGLSRPVWTSQGAPNAAELRVDSVIAAEPGQSGSVAGNISAQLCRKESPAADVDPNDCRAIELRFETGLLFE